MTRMTGVSTDEVLTVSEVSRLAGVSVRALHHYDEIGLLLPSARTEAGYRLYSREDLDRLQEILLFRELEIPLDDIAVLLAGGAFDRRAALELQREMLTQKIARTEALITSVERAINAERTGVRMTKEETFEVFGDFDPAEYEDEVKRALGRHRRLQGVGAAHGALHQGRLGALQGREPADRHGHRGAHGRGRAGKRPARDGPRRGCAVADRHLVLPVLARDAREPRRDVHRRPALHGDLREDTRGHGAYWHDAILANAARQ